MGGVWEDGLAKAVGGPGLCITEEQFARPSPTGYTSRMRFDPQTLVVLLFVALAVGLLARRLVRWVRTGGSSACGGCGSCGGKSESLVSLTDLSAPPGKS